MMIYLVRIFMHQILRNPPAALRIFVLTAAILLYGTTGFVYFELQGNPELTWTDGLWYTLVTMTTVGYGDFFPRTAGGRFLVGWPIMFFGIGILGYALSVIAAAMVTSKTKELKGMASFTFSNHLVLFNFPGLAKVERVLEELSLDPAFGKSVPVILIDEHLEELPQELLKRNMHFVRGNPTRDETLSRASIDRARHAVVLSRDPGDPASDNLNVSIAIAIEGRCQRVNTVIECIAPAAEELLRKTGCDRIVCASRFEANFLSQELLNPGLQDIIADLLSARGGQQIYLTTIGRSARFAEIRDACSSKGHVALGISGQAGILLNTGENHTVAPEDRVITIGPSRIPFLFTA